MSEQMAVKQPAGSLQSFLVDVPTIVTRTSIQTDGQQTEYTFDPPYHLYPKQLYLLMPPYSITPEDARPLILKVSADPDDPDRCHFEGFAERMAGTQAIDVDTKLRELVNAADTVFQLVGRLAP